MFTSPISAARFKTFVKVLPANLIYYIAQIFANVIPLFFKTKKTFKSKSTDLGIKNTLKLDRTVVIKSHVIKRGVKMNS